jgi:quercetin dioxygenase-like cupin family protein
VFALLSRGRRQFPERPQTYISLSRKRNLLVSFEHAPKAREVVQHDASGEWESLSRGAGPPSSAALRRVISNPISGEHIVIHTSGAETNGELLIFDLFLPPGKQVPSRHTHPIQEERFTILAGTMRFRLGWRSILATTSDTIVIPPGVAHWFGNIGPGMVHARVEVRPALRMEELFATAATIEIGADHSIRRWLRQLPIFARLLLEFQREVAVPDLAAWLVRPVLAMIARLDRRSANADRAASSHGRS